MPGTVKSIKRRAPTKNSFDIRVAIERIVLRSCVRCFDVLENRWLLFSFDLDDNSASYYLFKRDAISLIIDFSLFIAISLHSTTSISFRELSTWPLIVITTAIKRSGQSAHSQLDHNQN